MTKWRVGSLMLIDAACGAVASQSLSERTVVEAQRRGGERAATPPYAVPHAPAGVKEGETWIPELPGMDAVAPPAGWQPSRVEVPWMPATLLRLPRTNL